MKKKKVFTVVVKVKPSDLLGNPIKAIIHGVYITINTYSYLQKVMNSKKEG